MTESDFLRDHQYSMTETQVAYYVIKDSESFAFYWRQIDSRRLLAFVCSRIEF